jgi:RHS repeat-associated protein
MSPATPPTVCSPLPRGQRGAARGAMLVVALLGLALLAPLSAQAQGQSVITRSSSFEYGTTAGLDLGLLIKEIVEPDPARVQDCLQTSYSYDTYGNKTSVSTSACLGASGTLTWSATSARTAASSYAAQTATIAGVTYAIPAGMFPASTSNALGQSESKAYDPRFGAVTSLVGPNGLTTSWGYDSFGRKTIEQRADGTSTQWAYKLCTDASSGLPNVPAASCPAPIASAVAQWVAIEQSYQANSTTPNGHPKYQYYDTLDRVIRIQTKGFDGNASGAPAVTLYQDTQYNALGQVAASSNLYDASAAPLWTSYTYDALGRVTLISAPDNTSNTMAYDGLSSTATNALGQKKTTLKNAQGQVAQVTDDQLNTIRYAYDAIGQLIETNAGGSITKMVYNQRGQKILMEDPAMGVWQYAYNAFGELVWQKDSLGQATTMAYDQLGRMTQRNEADLNSQWSYDKNFDNSVCAKGIGKLCQAKTDNGYLRSHSYDDKGRIQSTATLLGTGASTATVSVSYDPSTARVASKTWPTGYQASYQYTAMGYLKKVSGGNTAITGATVASYEVLDIDAQGRIRSYKYGNNITTVKAYDLPSGNLTGIQASLAGGTASGVMNQSYAYDSLHNLRTRSDGNTGVNESFQYDNLNRLSNYNAVGAGLSSTSPNFDVQVLYDARGNISYKSDVGQYWYDGQRPNRMTAITLSTPAGGKPLTGTRKLTYAFDDYRVGALTPSNSSTPLGNGNLMYSVSQDLVQNRHSVRWEEYTSFNMPREIKYGNLLDINNPTGTTSDRTLTFVYGPEHQRTRQRVQLSANAPAALQSGAGDTWYLNGEDSQGLSYEKEVKTNGITEHKHYLSAGGITFAMHVTRVGTLAAGNPSVPGSTQTSSLRYFHHDQLGSIAAISDEAGKVIERLAYDPWGKRRNTNGPSDVSDSLIGLTTDRGFTGHEHLDEMGIIHMNGRLYDPLIGRFMSADPFIQAPGNLQSYNRYAYVMNNPLNLTDPSGYSAWTRIRGFVVAVVAAVADAYGCAGYCSQAVQYYNYAKTAQAYYNAYQQGGWSAVGKSYLRSTLSDMVGQAAFGGSGDVGVGQEYGFEHYLATAAAGCVSSVASGGKCGSGAAAAVAGKFATQMTEGGDLNSQTRYFIAQAAGGLASEAAGGKFANGAQTAAYGYLFNDLSHEARARLIGAGAVAGGTLGAVGAGACAAGSGGVCALGAPTMIAGGAALGAVTGDALATGIDSIGNAINGNSWLSPNPTTVYQLVSNADNSVWKYGITDQTNPQDRYSASYYSQFNVRMEPIMQFGSRAPARILEIGLCSAYVVSNGKLPTLSSRC